VILDRDGSVKEAEQMIMGWQGHCCADSECVE
jgi:hypothetical protein